MIADVLRGSERTFLRPIPAVGVRQEIRKAVAMVARLKVKVVPGASSAGVHGWLGDSLKVRVTAPPEKGRANKEVEALIGKALSLQPGAVRVVSGRTSPRKVLEVEGLSDADIRQRLDATGDR